MDGKLVIHTRTLSWWTTLKWESFSPRRIARKTLETRLWAQSIQFLEEQAKDPIFSSNKLLLLRSSTTMPQTSLKTQWKKSVNLQEDLFLCSNTMEILRLRTLSFSWLLVRKAVKKWSNIWTRKAERQVFWRSVCIDLGAKNIFWQFFPNPWSESLFWTKPERTEVWVTPFT